MHLENGPIFQSSAMVKAKDCKVQDKDLLWDEFSEANHQVLKAMHQQDRPEEWIKMVCDFWLIIKGHEFQHGKCKYAKCALLVDQGQVHKQWHQAIGTPDTFSLTPISEYHLMSFQKKLRDTVLNSQIELLKKVSCIP